MRTATAAQVTQGRHERRRGGEAFGWVAGGGIGDGDGWRDG